MIKFAIVGCGRIAKKHAEAIKNAQDAELFALCDTDDERLSTMASENNVKHTYNNLSEMVTNSEIDVINICTPNAIHAENAIEAIEAGKHVMVEKPIATSVEDAEKIIDAAKRNGVKATAVHQNRFNEAIQKTRRAYEEGKFGEMSHGVASIRWNRNMGYYNQDSWRGTVDHQDGVLMNQCIHNIDLLIWMMGPVKSVTGKTVTRFRDIDMEDVGSAILEFENGSIGVIEGAGTIYPTNLEETLNLFGRNATVCIGGIAVNKIETWRFSSDFQEDEQKVLEQQQDNPPTVYGFGHQLIVQDMVDSIKNDREPYITLEDGRNAVEVVLAIYKSSQLGQPVEISKKVKVNN
ncbi:Gfo/Idh/MocA family protein [Halobacillus karajensis]|uniref:Oxidoreductase YcjS n=1 Tax=Halobacillus karajensis TaxID=195088 RepID=A0A059NYB7_9BACI|nr:Gfo/Idh/MocA family oxidoreductase [Halobacillus karajensis]CDQ18945.1 putative oxidoreductase YcjS [Halobacillus karajensis]CDQ22982.1 putative oxidoreductase YcjS [Halobacillus karajensis]CDQ26464.1 putative oxidoreductase YcjS [Halobacillus karajensis]